MRESSVCVCVCVFGKVATVPAYPTLALQLLCFTNGMVSSNYWTAFRGWWNLLEKNADLAQKDAQVSFLVEIEWIFGPIWLKTCAWWCEYQTRWNNYSHWLKNSYDLALTSFLFWACHEMQHSASLWSPAHLPGESSNDMKCGGKSQNLCAKVQGGLHWHILMLVYGMISMMPVASFGVTVTFCQKFMTGKMRKALFFQHWSDWISLLNWCRDHCCYLNWEVFGWGWIHSTWNSTWRCSIEFGFNWLLKS